MNRRRHILPEVKDLPDHARALLNDRVQMRFALLDPDQERSYVISNKVFSPLALAYNYNFPLFRFYHKIPVGYLERCAPWVHLAMVSMDCPDLSERLQELYCGNPNCLIVLYGQKKPDMETLFPSRPVRFLETPAAIEAWEWDKIGTAFAAEVDRLLDEHEFGNPVYAFVTRGETRLIAQNEIVYLENEKKITHLHLRGSMETIQVSKPLSEISAELGPGFMQIHKSYIVNFGYVNALDKKNHMIQLIDGRILPVSDAYYDTVRRRMERLDQGENND